jgi:flagellar hook protein FlgE
MSLFDLVGTASSNATTTSAAVGRNAGSPASGDKQNSDIETDFSSLVQTIPQQFQQATSSESKPDFLDKSALDVSEIKSIPPVETSKTDPNCDETPGIKDYTNYFLNEKGDLLDDNGAKVLGYPYSQMGIGSVVDDNRALQTVNLPYIGLAAEGSTSGTIVANLNATAAIIETNKLPSAKSGIETMFSHQTSMKALDRNGNIVLYDVYFSKTSPNTWQMTLFNAAGRNNTTGSFPYSPGSLVTTPVDLEFDAAGRLSKPSTAEADIVVPGWKNSEDELIMNDMTIYFSALSQGTQEFSSRISTNGNPLSVLENFNISSDGTVYAQYTGGSLTPKYQLPTIATAKLNPSNALSNISGVSDISGASKLDDTTTGGQGKMHASAALQSLKDDSIEPAIASSDSLKGSTISDLINILFP